MSATKISYFWSSETLLILTNGRNYIRRQDEVRIPPTVCLNLFSLVVKNIAT